MGVCPARASPARACGQGTTAQTPSEGPGADDDQHTDVLRSAASAALAMPASEREAAVPAAVRLLLNASEDREAAAKMLTASLDAGKDRLPAETFSPLLQQASAALAEAADAAASAGPGPRGGGGGRASQKSSGATVIYPPTVGGDAGARAAKALTPKAKARGHARQAGTAKKEEEPEDSDEDDGGQPFVLGPVPVPLATLLNVVSGLCPEDLTPAAGSCKSLCIAINLNLQYTYFLVRLLRLIALGPELAQAVGAAEDNTSSEGAGDEEDSISSEEADVAGSEGEAGSTKASSHDQHSSG